MTRGWGCVAATRARVRGRSRLDASSIHGGAVSQPILADTPVVRRTLVKAAGRRPYYSYYTYYCSSTLQPSRQNRGGQGEHWITTRVAVATSCRLLLRSTTTSSQRCLAQRRHAQLVREGVVELLVPLCSSWRFWSFPLCQPTRAHNRLRHRLPTSTATNT